MPQFLSLGKRFSPVSGLIKNISLFFLTQAIGKEYSLEDAALPA